MAQIKTKAGSKVSTSRKSAKRAQTKRPTKNGGTTQERALKTSGAEEVSIDRRRKSDRRDGESAAADVNTQANQPLERRKKVNRRRQIDPTTCERDYTDQEVEFMNALDDYKRRSGRMFPTCSEVLEVLHSLGYVKLSPAELATIPGTAASAPSAKPMLSDAPVLETANTESASAFESATLSAC